MDPVTLHKIFYGAPVALLVGLALFTAYHWLRLKRSMADSAAKRKALQQELEVRHLEITTRVGQMQGAQLTVVGQESGKLPQRNYSQSPPPTINQPGRWLCFQIQVDPPAGCPGWWLEGLQICYQEPELPGVHRVRPHYLEKHSPEACLQGTQTLSLTTYVPNQFKEVQFRYYEIELARFELNSDSN